MKKTIFIITLLLVALSANGQDSKFSATVSYPFPIDENFIGEFYNGIIDLGIQYSFANTEMFLFGASINGSYLKGTNENFNPPVDIDAFIIQPRIYGELAMEKLQGFKPFLGLGYTITSLDVKDNGTPGITDASDSFGGFNLNVGASYDISSKAFVILQYDFIKLSRDDAPDFKYNTNINLLKLGLGYRF